MEIIMTAIQKRLSRKAIVTNAKKELVDALHTWVCFFNHLGWDLKLQTDFDRDNDFSWRFASL